MEDENGLDLSLSLPCGGCPTSWKSKNGKSSNVRAEESDRDCKLTGDFKFLDGNTQKLDGISLPSSDWMKDEENFFSKDAFRKLSSGGFWTEVEEEKTTEVGHKRKSLFGESERDAHRTDFVENSRSKVSINMIAGSTAENEEIANTEAEGSTSGPVSHHDDSSKQCDSGYADLTSKRRFIISPENEVKFGNAQYFASLKDSNPTGTVSRSSYPVPSMVPVMSATASSERPGTQPIIPANVPLMFGYSPVLLPSLDKNNSCGPISHFQHQQFHPSYTRGPLNINKDYESLKISQDVASQSSQHDGKATECMKSNGKHHATEEGCSSKGTNIIFTGKHPSEQPQTDTLPSEFPPIRLGLSADLKFEGSSPDLPWVSTTAPNGKTISGVTYWFSPSQIKIVCACHGLHLSPDEFVLHASGHKTTTQHIFSS